MSGIMLDKDPSESFERAKHRAMDHDRCRLLAVRPYIKRPKPAGQVEVDLRRTALPFASDRVAQRIFKFRPVKSAFARIDSRLKAAFREFLQHPRQSGFGLVPGFVRADALFRPRR